MVAMAKNVLRNIHKFLIFNNYFNLLFIVEGFCLLLNAIICLLIIFTGIESKLFFAC